MLQIKKQHLFLFGLFLTILPYSYLCFFTNPSADDFVYAYHFQTENYLVLLKQNYLGWNGRYASNIFSNLNPIGFNSFLGYKAASFAMLCLVFLSFFCLVKQVFHQKKNFLTQTFSILGWISFLMRFSGFVLLPDMPLTIQI